MPPPTPCPRAPLGSAAANAASPKKEGTLALGKRKGEEAVGLVAVACARGEGVTSGRRS